jgi:hypothetical protein
MKKPLTILIAICFLVINLVCKKSTTSKHLNTIADSTKTITYIIKKGEHDCQPDSLTLTSNDQIKFIAIFDSSCIYQTVNAHNQNDINKLYGFSDCNSQHLENSARIGWRWSKDSLRFFGFVHNNGEMIYQEITTAAINSIVVCSITCLYTQYKFDVNGKTLLLPRSCSGSYTRYRLYPYFGGDEVAPHDIKIQITELQSQ